MSLLDLDRLVVSQKAKLVELTNEYGVFDEEGTRVGSIRQEGQSALRKVARLVSSVDQFMTHRLGVYDVNGSKVLELVRPRKFLKSRIEVSDGQGMPVGTILQENVMGKKRFRLDGAGGEVVGAINAENWRAWDFRILDVGGKEVGRITKKWHGAARELFTTADKYLVEVDREVQGPLRLLAMASAAGIDTALKQDAQGFN